MRINTVVVILGLALAMSGCQLSGKKPSGAKEGYFSWVDEQGRVRYSPIPETDASEEDQRVEKLITGGSEPTAVAQDEDSDTRSETSNQPSGTKRHSEFNLENYPDGVELEKRGHIRPGDPEPYFTWRDAQGNVRVSYYRPDLRTAVEKGDIKPPLELTEATIYLADRQTEQAELPANADPVAAAVLGLTEAEEPFLRRWQSFCCESLDRAIFADWEAGREFGVEIDAESVVHEFATGDSHYGLVRLPNGSDVDDFILQVRSFDQKGVFVPTFAFLDAEFHPIRLVTDVVAEFIPESWHSLGHLQAFVPVFPGKGERWLLIYTTTDDLQEQTVIDTRFGPKAIPHVGTGQLGLQKTEQ